MIRQADRLSACHFMGPITVPEQCHECALPENPRYSQIFYLILENSCLNYMSRH